MYTTNRDMDASKQKEWLYSWPDMGKPFQAHWTIKTQSVPGAVERSLARGGDQSIHPIRTCNARDGDPKDTPLPGHTSIAQYGILQNKTSKFVKYHISFFLYFFLLLFKVTRLWGFWGG